MPCAFSKYREALTVTDTQANCCKGEILLQRKSIKSPGRSDYSSHFFLMVFGAAMFLRKKQKLRKVSQKQARALGHTV